MKSLSHVLYGMSSGVLTVNANEIANAFPGGKVSKLGASVDKSPEIHE
jgi:hypothetical protein